MEEYSPLKSSPEIIEPKKVISYKEKEVRQPLDDKINKKKTPIKSPEKIIVDPKTPDKSDLTETEKIIEEPGMKFEIPLSENI